MDDATLRNRGTEETAALIVASLERAAALCPDLTPPVYARLFATHPETRTMFRAEARDLVKGSMLQMALEAILDFVGERQAAHRMIFCEVQSHEAYGTSPDLFRAFFVVIVDALRELLGEEWSPAIDAAWRDTVVEINRYIDEALGV